MKTILATLLSAFALITFSACLAPSPGPGELDPQTESILRSEEMQKNRERTADRIYDARAPL